MRGAWALVRFLALFDLGTFDGVRRRPFRQLVGECLILCCPAFPHGPFRCFGHGRIIIFYIDACHIKAPSVYSFANLPHSRCF
jgi:hypothetical protein